jgi:hypothetical protein
MQPGKNAADQTFNCLQQIATSWVAFDFLCCKIQDIFKEKCSLCDKLYKVDVMLTSFKSRRCILIEQDVHQFRGHTSRISNWENVCPIEERILTGKFLLFSELFKSKSGSTDNKHNYLIPIPYYTNYRINILLLEIGEQLLVARDYNKLKDELEEKNDEIQMKK